MRRRWRRWQVALIVVAIVALSWGARYYDDASTSLSNLSRRIGTVVEWLCPTDSDGERGECGFDEGMESGAPTDELNGLQATMDSLPLGWTTGSLFPAETSLCIPGGQRAVLSWPARADDGERVLDGRISVRRGTLGVTFRTGPGSSRASRQRAVRAPGTTRLVVATTVGAMLELSCLGSSSAPPCRLVLGNESGDLSGDGQC